MRFCLEIILGMALSLTALAAGGPSLGTGTAGAGTASDHAVWVVTADPHSGKLVRRLVAPPKTTDAGAQVRDLIDEAARNYDVNPLLVDSVIQVESNYNPFAVSPKGAEGLMQLMPGTAQRFGVTNSFDPRQNIEAGVRYLKFLKDTFQDDRLAIAAYNAGEKAVAKYKDVPPYPETVSYVAKVGKKYGQAERAARTKQDANKSRREAKNAEEPKADATEQTPRHILAYVDTEGRLHIATQQ